MDADTLQRIMRPYQRNNDETIGEGLGLSIVSNLVREQGWMLETISALGKGSTFRITNIPLHLD